jgi:HNH endonuclease
LLAKIVIGGIVMAIQRFRGLSEKAKLKFQERIRREEMEEWKKQEQRFWEKVDKSLGDSGCWLWTAGKNSEGRGNLKFREKGQDKSKNEYAYRVSWILTYGNNPSDLNILHVCNNVACVNPGHLELGTHQDNMNDRNIRGRTRWKGYKPSRIEDIVIILGPKEMSLASYWNNFSVETRKELEAKVGIPSNLEVATRKQKSPS